jgi:D-alanine-D-alanine ligase
MKQNIALLFGGQSSEHEVSLRSATTIMKHIDTSRYEVYPVGITKEGKWLLYTGAHFDFTQNNWQEKGVRCVLSPDAKHSGLLTLREEEPSVLIKLDKVFPVLHGKNGEDGTVQGLCQLAQIPYVGCGVLASALAMDKACTKLIAKEIGVPQANYTLIKKAEVEAAKSDSTLESLLQKIEEAFPYPYFIKPANAGSSVGVSKATNKEELLAGIKEALIHDDKVLIEETIVGREVETAVLGNETVSVSGVGEILAAAEFYDYEAKYNNEDSKTIVNADLPAATKDQIREYAKAIFVAIGGKGLSRVDFFVKEDGNIIFNEINTLPGFTSISMYPMLFEEAGVPIPQLVTRLIELASL